MVSNRSAWSIVAVITFAKLLIIATFPLTGDEAYFIRWASQWEWGYYDHPPMVGWLIGVMQWVSDSHIFYRAFAVVTAFVVAWSIYAMARYYVDSARARFAALLFLVSPVDVLMVLMTNDIALLFFVALGSWMWVAALHETRWGRYAFGAGLFLGLAFLSKYFALFIVLAFVFHALVHRVPLWRVVVLVVVSAAIGLENLYFNYTCCWNNILFNMVARTQESLSAWSGFSLFALFVLYYVTPWGAYWVWRARGVRELGALRTLAWWVLGVLGLVLGAVSLSSSVGLHWFLVGLPALYALFATIPAARMKLFFYTNATFALLHVVVLTALALAPLHLFEGSKSYTEVALLKEHDAVCSALDSVSHPLFATAYTPASIYSYYCNRPLSTLFNTAKYGRQDDKWVDVRALEGQTIALFDWDMSIAKRIEGVCQSVDMQPFPIAKAQGYIFTCHHFSYEKYKNLYLDTIRNAYYTPPAWLPKGECYFDEMYYSQEVLP